MKKNETKTFAAVFKALSNENRLKVFLIIRKGRTRTAADCGESPEGIPHSAVCVCEILEQLNVTAPTLSHHLKELRNAGLVEARSSGQWSYYTARDDVMDSLEKFFKTSAPEKSGRGGRA